MKLRTLIIDDEPLAHDVIVDYIEDVPFLEVVGQCHLATDALQFLNKNTVDLIFLDIQMPKLQGLNFLKTLSNPPIVIITSAHEEYALESFEQDVCDYLLKPFRFDRFLKAANKAQELHRLKNATEKNNISGTQKADSATNSEQLFLKTDQKFINLRYSDIFYLESYGNYVKVWVEDEFHLTLRTLSSFEEQLPPSQFMRIHKSYIVHKPAVDYLEGNTIVMRNGQDLPLGKTHKRMFKAFMQEG